MLQIVAIPEKTYRIKYIRYYLKLSLLFLSLIFTSSLVMFLILTSAGDRVNPRSVILNNGSSATLYSQDASHLQDDILWRGPTRQGSCQLHSNHLKEGFHTGRDIHVDTQLAILGNKPDSENRI